jgi:hypothetical protein
MPELNAAAPDDVDIRYSGGHSLQQANGQE